MAGKTLANGWRQRYGYNMIIHDSDERCSDCSGKHGKTSKARFTNTLHFLGQGLLFRYEGRPQSPERDERFLSALQPQLDSCNIRVGFAALTSSLLKPCEFLVTARMCDTCLAAKGKFCRPAMSHRNFGASAAWPLTETPYEAYMQLETPSPWSVVHGWRLETCAYDFMHVVYLGTGRDLIASAIRLMVKLGVFGPYEDLDTLLGEIHAEIRRTCGDHGFRAKRNQQVLLCL